MKRLVIATAVICAMLIPAVAGAQNLPPGKWWKRPDVVQHLGLSMTQQDQLEQNLPGPGRHVDRSARQIEKASIALRSEQPIAPSSIVPP